MLILKARAISRFEIVVRPILSPAFSDANVWDNRIVCKNAVLAKRHDHLSTLFEDAEETVRCAMINKRHTIMKWAPLVIDFANRLIADRFVNRVTKALTS
ncbi:hypothetical protein EAH79_12495 [Sphingomonas koreensis]|nr:hypothetical protein EAH79_12495 [Sphingomonas koreensis]